MINQTFFEEKKNLVCAQCEFCGHYTTNNKMFYWCMVTNSDINSDNKACDLFTDAQPW